MTRFDKLREQIRREPDDDGLRLVWAGALTEAGELATCFGGEIHDPDEIRWI